MKQQTFIMLQDAWAIIYPSMLVCKYSMIWYISCVEMTYVAVCENVYLLPDLMVRHNTDLSPPTILA